MQNKLCKRSKSGVSSIFEISEDRCPLEHDSPKVVIKDQILISAIDTKAEQNNRVKREIHTQSITGLSVLCSHSVFSLSHDQKTPKIPLIAPVLKPFIDNMGFPVPFICC